MIKENEMEHKHTLGPWFADERGGIWRRDPKYLYENGSEVAGDKPLAIAYIGWRGENVQGYPLEANARLIAAAPDMLEAAARLDLACTVDPLNPCWAGRPGDVLGQHWGGGDACPHCHLRAAIAKATGTQS